MWLCGLIRCGSAEKRHRSQDVSIQQGFGVKEVKPEPPQPERTSENALALLRDASALLVVFQHMPCPVSLVLRDTGDLILQNRPSVELWGDLRGRQPLLEVLFRFADEDVLATALTELTNSGQWKGLLRVPASVNAACRTTPTGGGALTRKSWTPSQRSPTLPLPPPSPPSPATIEFHTKPKEHLEGRAVSFTLAEGSTHGCMAAYPTSDAHPVSDRVTAIIPSAATESTNWRAMTLTRNGSSVVREQSTTALGSAALCFTRTASGLQLDATPQDTLTCLTPHEKRPEEERQSSLGEVLFSVEGHNGDGGGGAGSTADKRRPMLRFGHSTPLTLVQPPPAAEAADEARAPPAPPDNTNRASTPWTAATSNIYTADTSSTPLPGPLPSTSPAKPPLFTPCNSVPMTLIDAPAAGPVVSKDAPPMGHTVLSERVGRFRRPGTMLLRASSTVLHQDTAVSAPGLALMRSCRQEDVLSSNTNLMSAGNTTVSVGAQIHSVPPRSEQQQQQALLHALTTSAWGTMMKSSCGRRLPRRTSSVQMLMGTSGASFSSAVSGAGPRMPSIHSAIHETQQRTLADWQTEDAVHPSGGPYSAAAMRAPTVSEMGVPSASSLAVHAAGRVFTGAGPSIGAANGPPSTSAGGGVNTNPSASYIDMRRRTCFDGTAPQSGLRPCGIQDLQQAGAPGRSESVTAGAPALVSASTTKKCFIPEPAQQEGSPAHSNTRCGLASSPSMGAGNGAMARILSITLATVGSKNSLRQRTSSASPLNALLQAENLDSGPVDSSQSQTPMSDATQRQSFTVPLAGPRETASHRLLAAPASSGGIFENKADKDWMGGGEGEAEIHMAVGEAAAAAPHPTVQSPTLEAVDHGCRGDRGQVGGVKVFTRGGSTQPRTPTRVSEAQMLGSLDLRPDPTNLHGTMDSETAMLMYREAFDKIERPLERALSSDMQLTNDNMATNPFTSAAGGIQRKGRLALHGSTLDSMDCSALQSPSPGHDVTLTLTLAGPSIALMDAMPSGARNGEGHESTSAVAVSVGVTTATSLDLQVPLPVVPLHLIACSGGVNDVAPPREPSGRQQTPSHQQVDSAAAKAGMSCGVQPLAKSVLVAAAVSSSPQPLDSESQVIELNRHGLDAASGGGAGSRLQPPSVPAKAVPAPAVPPQREREMAAETEEKDFSWHEVALTCFEHPQLQRQVILIVQNDVSERIWAERQLVRVVEAEHTLLENIFPHHVIEHIATTAATKANQANEMDTPGLVMLNARLSHAGPPGGGGIASLAAAGDDGVGDPGRLPTIRGDTFLHLATSHTAITVLFCDIQGFTPMCNEVRPVVVMSFLNDLFTRLDAMLDKYGVYKVETIGDCYVAAGGLMKVDEETGAVTVRSDDVDPQHAHRTVHFAKALLRVASHVRLPTSGQPVRLRVGIHSGPAMSGVVGTRMPRFCLFGDTMNTASRMESTGVPGAIHVSQATKDLVPEESWEPTGGVPVKGKGTMNTFLLRP